MRDIDKNVRRRLRMIGELYPKMGERELYRESSHHFMRWYEYIDYLYYNLIERNNSEVRKRMMIYEEDGEGDNQFTFSHHLYSHIDEE